MGKSNNIQRKNSTRWRKLSYQGAKRVIPLLLADFVLMCVSANTENSEQLLSHDLQYSQSCIGLYI